MKKLDSVCVSTLRQLFVIEVFDPAFKAWVPLCSAYPTRRHANSRARALKSLFGRDIRMPRVLPYVPHD